MNIHTIDLLFQGIPNTIGSFLVESNEELILFETGPHSCYPTLKKGIEDLGYACEQIKHVFLTHIHFDHAGAAWTFAEAGAKIYVHPVGAPHLIRPEKLLASAKRLYKDMMDQLWGEMKPIPEESIYIPQHEEVIQIGGLDIKALYTPGHATHHIAWAFDEVIICGDVGGIKLQNGPVLPPCPPPDINLEDWYESLNILRNQKASRLFLTHFGEIRGNAAEHLDVLESVLKKWLTIVEQYFHDGLSEKEAIPLFQKYNDEEVLKYTGDKEMVVKYAAANPAWTSVYGIYRYLKKKKEA